MDTKELPKELEDWINKNPRLASVYYYAGLLVEEGIDINSDMGLSIIRLAFNADLDEVIKFITKVKTMN